MNDEIMMFGIPLAKVTEAEAVERIVEFARKGRASRGHAAFVATLNVDFVCNAVRAADKKDGFVSVGVDSDDIEIQALRDGYLSAIIVQNAYEQGYKCMENAIRTVVTGTNPEEAKQVNCPPVIVTLDNIDSEEINFIMNPQLAN